jgi:hypothetical protein
MDWAAFLLLAIAYWLICAAFLCLCKHLLP